MTLEHLSLYTCTMLCQMFHMLYCFLFFKSILPIQFQDYDAIKSELLSSGKLFEDPKFEASSKQLVDGRTRTLVSYSGRSKFDKNAIEWLRPKVRFGLK